MILDEKWDAFADFEMNRLIQDFRSRAAMLMATEIDRQIMGTVKGSDMGCCDTEARRFLTGYAAIEEAIRSLRETKFITVMDQERLYKLGTDVGKLTMADILFVTELAGRLGAGRQTVDPPRPASAEFVGIPMTFSIAGCDTQPENTIATPEPRKPRRRVPKASRRAKAKR